MINVKRAVFGDLYFEFCLEFVIWILKFPQHVFKETRN